MPKAFSETERKQIRERLLDAGKKLINSQGPRRLSIDELVRAAGIAKGSFYAFFPSREDFILAVFEAWEDQYRAAFLARMEDPALEPRQRWERFFADFIGLMEREPGLALMGSADVVTLMSRLPPERLVAHQARDQAVLDEAMARWLERGWVSPAGAAVLPGLVMALFAILLHRKDFGDADFGATMAFLASALADRLGGGSP